MATMKMITLVETNGYTTPVSKTIVVPDTIDFGDAAEFASNKMADIGGLLLTAVGEAIENAWTVVAIGGLYLRVRRYGDNVVSERC